MIINATWHRAHRMPQQATAMQRLQWHTQHAKHCACRPFTTTMKNGLLEKIQQSKNRRLQH